MQAVMATVDTFVEESRHEGALRFEHLVESLRDSDTSWDDLGRPPTPLEIMSACCTLENQGTLRLHLIGGLMHVV
jgi:hypothetical protein